EQYTPPETCGGSPGNRFPWLRPGLYRGPGFGRGGVRMEAVAPSHQGRRARPRGAGVAEVARLAGAATGRPQVRRLPLPLPQPPRRSRRWGCRVAPAPFNTPNVPYGDVGGQPRSLSYFGGGVPRWSGG